MDVKLELFMDKVRSLITLEDTCKAALTGLVFLAVTNWKVAVCVIVGFLLHPLMSKLSIQWLYDDQVDETT